MIKMINKSLTLGNIKKVIGNREISIKGTEITFKGNENLYGCLCEVFLDNYLTITPEKSEPNSTIYRFDIKSIESIKPIYSLISIQHKNYIHASPEYFIKTLLRVVSNLDIENSKDIEVSIDNERGIFGMCKYEVFGVKILFQEGRIISCLDNKLGIFNLNMHRMIPSVELLLNFLSISYESDYSRNSIKLL